jgi:hypothetical protein
MNTLHEADYGAASDNIDALYEARALWQRKGWLLTPRVMAECGIDLALDEFNRLRADDNGSS